MSINNHNNGDDLDLDPNAIQTVQAQAAPIDDDEDEDFEEYEDGEDQEVYRREVIDVKKSLEEGLFRPLTELLSGPVAQEEKDFLIEAAIDLGHPEAFSALLAAGARLDAEKVQSILGPSVEMRRPYKTFLKPWLDQQNGKADPMSVCQVVAWLMRVPPSKMSQTMLQSIETDLKNAVSGAAWNEIVLLSAALEPKAWASPVWSPILKSILSADPLVIAKPIGLVGQSPLDVAAAQNSLSAIREMVKMSGQAPSSLSVEHTNLMTWAKKVRSGERPYEPNRRSRSNSASAFDVSMLFGGCCGGDNQKAQFDLNQIKIFYQSMEMFESRAQTMAKMASKKPSGP